MSLVGCPSCGFTFDRNYARAFGSSASGRLYLSCGMLNCPKCSQEFEL